MNDHFNAKLFPILHQREQLKADLAKTTAAYERQKKITEINFHKDMEAMKKVLPQIAKLTKYSYSYVPNLQVQESGAMTYGGQVVYYRPIPTWTEGYEMLRNACEVLSSPSTPAAAKHKAAHTLACVYNTFCETLRRQDELLQQRIQINCNLYEQTLQRLRVALAELDRQYPHLEDQLREADRTIRQGVDVDTCEELTDRLEIPIGAELLDYEGNTYLASLHTWGLDQDGSLHILDETPVGQDRSGLDRFLKDLALRFLCAYPHSALCLNYTHHIEISRLAGQVPNKMIQSFSQSSLLPSAATLTDYIDERFEIMGRSHCENMLEYNLRNPSDPQKLLLVIFDEQNLQTRSIPEEVLASAHLAGVYFVFISKPRKQGYEASILTQLSTKFFRYNAAQCEDTLFYEDSCLFLPLRTDAQRSDRDLCAELRERNAERSLSFNEIIRDHHPASPAWEELSIPYGQVNGRLQTLTLDMTSAHVAILGPNGTGKSNLMRALVLGAAYHYTPRDCRVVIVDGEKSLGEAYKEGELPHLWCSLTSRQNLDLYTFWSWLNGEKNRRSDLFDKNGCSDLKEYNEKVSEEERLPRLLVFVDEFSSMCSNLFERNERLLREFSALLRASRSAGISLIVSVVDKPTIFRNNNLTAQFAHAIEFSAGKLQGALISRTGRWPDLPEGMGYCWYKKARNSTIDMVKVAHVDEQEAYLEEIKARYSEYKMKLVTDDITDGLDLSPDAAWLCKAEEEYGKGYLRVPVGISHFFGEPQFITFGNGMSQLSIFGERWHSLRLIKCFLESGSRIWEKTGVETPIIIYGDFSVNHSNPEEEAWRTYCDSLEFPCASDAEKLTKMRDNLNDLITERQASKNRPPVLVILTGFECVTNQADAPEHLKYNEWRRILMGARDVKIYCVLQFNDHPANQGTNYIEDCLRNVILVPDDDQKDQMQRNQVIKRLYNPQKKIIPLEVVEDLPAHLIALCINGQAVYIKPYEF